MEKKERVSRDPQMLDLAKELSGISKNVGTVGFMIKYSATPGNLKIHEGFQRYAFDEANNEYLVAIDKLLQNAKFIDYFRVLDERITILENKEQLKEEPVKQEEYEGEKTF